MEKSGREMKLVLIILTICFVETYCQISLFQAVFEKLHQEPKLAVKVFRDNFDVPKNNIEVKYIEQKLDNFNENDNRTWWMRYMSNDYYFKINGPIFVLVGGEWEISDFNLRGGHMYDMAKSLSGYMFYTEHRFYGRSQPFRTLETSNLQYLNVRQSLADLANFIRTVKTRISGLQSSKVILIGASYSGAMVTWFNRLYPELVDGTWASSAPLLAKVDFSEAKEIAGVGISELGSAACYNRIKNGISAFEKDIENGELDTIKQYINLCADFDPKYDKDVMMLFASIADTFSTLVQVYLKDDIKAACTSIMSTPSDVEGVGKFLKERLQTESQCVRVKYQDNLDLLQNIALDNIMRQWYHQSCNEFGWFQTSSSSNQPFGTKFPIEFFISLCRDVYGIEYDLKKAQQNVEATNAIFGGLDPQVKNIFFTHGGLDPWKALGIICDGECGTVVPLYSHIKDLASASQNDSQDMLDLKRTVFQLVMKWIK